MKPDWDCIRAILVALEEKGDAASLVHPKAIVEFLPVAELYTHPALFSSTNSGTPSVRSTIWAITSDEATGR